MNIDRLKEKHAKRFKKLVMKVEKTKWKLIKKIDKNYLTRCEKTLEKNKENLLKKANTEEEKRNIITKYKSNILQIRKEYYSEKNNNYHIDMLDPDKSIKHLESNKTIHKKWLVVDAAIVSALATCTIIGLGNIVFIPVVGYVCLEAIKNIECINLQNFCIEKVNKRKDVLQQRQIRQIESKHNKYGKAQELISNQLIEKDRIVTTDELLNAVEKTDIQTLKQLQELLRNEKMKRNKENINDKKKVMKREVR